MPYFRRPKDEQNPYARIHNAVLEDSDLSFKAKGILCYLLSKSDDWEVYQAQLSDLGPDGETAVRSGLKELIESGYVHRFQKKDGSGQFGQYLYIICEEPRSSVEAPETWFSDLGKPDIGKSDLGKSKPTKDGQVPTKDKTNDGEGRAHVKGDPPCSLNEAVEIAKDNDVSPTLARDWWHYYNARGWTKRFHSVPSALIRWKIQEQKMGAGTPSESFDSVEQLYGVELTEEQIESLLDKFPSLQRSQFGFDRFGKDGDPLYSLNPE